MAQNRQITVENIQKTVADYYKTEGVRHALEETHREHCPASVRWPWPWRSDLTQMSLPEIGEAFGNRDHTTVLHACRTIAR